MEGFIVDREYKSSLKCLRIGDKIAELPIIQGGMGVGVSRSSLAGAVAAEGGVGVISTAQIGYDEEGFGKDPAGVEIYDKDGYLIDLNNKDLEIFGVVNKSDVIGVNFFENPNVPQGIRDRVRNEDLVDFRLNYSFEQAGGYYETSRSNVIELYSKVSKLYDNEGNFSGYILISIDNTERIDAMNRIRDFENFFLMISDYAKVGYAKLNLLNRKGYAIKQLLITVKR